MASHSVLVMSILLALGMIAAGVASSDHHARVTKYWEEKLPGVAMPASLNDAISPIEGSALADVFAKQIERGSASTSASFCKMAGLVCGHKCKAAQLDKGAYNYKAAGEVEDVNLVRSKGYFLATDLVKGATLRLREQPHREARAFLPSIVADALSPLSPSSSESLQRIFNIHKGTAMYAAVDFALDVCHDVGSLPGEERACPTSLESLVDFAASHLGPDVKVLTSSPRPRTVMGPMKVTSFTEYSVQHGQNVVCHVLDFPSQLYMCHLVPDTKVFEASLTDADGAVTRAVGCCHLNTKTWNPEHQSFKILGVKPGTPVCHWSSDDTLVWVSAKGSARMVSGHDHTAM